MKKNNYLFLVILLLKILVILVLRYGNFSTKYSSIYFYSEKILLYFSSGFLFL